VECNKIGCKFAHSEDELVHWRAGAGRLQCVGAGRG
jgi:hypothetical protein